jgi:ABC-type polysaccharide/polyol phosphate transport system ATPase subunit
MASSIKLNAVSVDFPIYGMGTRSFKKQLLRLGTGGKLNSPENQIVTVKALDNISLEIEHGDRVGLIGHNGSGKSTLLRVISRIYEPTSGYCKISGKVSALLDVMCGMDPESTGYENIKLRGIINGLTLKKIQAKKQEIADFTDLGDYLSLPVRTYSTGMQLRLAFAIATSILPEVLVLDEVVGTGDAAFKEKAKMRFDAMVKASHIVVLASHDVELIEKFCNKVLWLDGGKVRFFGGAGEGLSLYRSKIR